MLDRVPMFIAQWILAIPAIIAMATGTLASVFVLTLMVNQKTDWDLLWKLAGVGLVFHVIVLGAFMSILRYQGGSGRIVGYSRGFWLGLIALGYLSGIGLGIFCGPA